MYLYFKNYRKKVLCLSIKYSQVANPFKVLCFCIVLNRHVGNDSDSGCKEKKNMKDKAMWRMQRETVREEFKSFMLYVRTPGPSLIGAGTLTKTGKRGFHYSNFRQMSKIQYHKIVASSPLCACLGSTLLISTELQLRPRNTVEI